MESALDHFLQTRGSAMLGRTAMGQSWKIQTALGGAFLAIGAVAAALPMFGAHPEMAMGAIGPALAGAVNLGVGLGFRNLVRRQGPEVQLSEQARALLHALVLRAQVWQGGWRSRGARRSHVWSGHQAIPQPPAAAMDALERAAASYNRIAAVLGDDKNERSARLRAAADAGMVEGIHQAAALAQYSGDGTPMLKAMEDTVQRLHELAERVEANALRPEGTSNLRSTLDATLEELRAEEVARQELLG